MNEKRYKVKIENGNIIPLEPIDLNEVKEGFVVLFDTKENLKPKSKDHNPLKDMIGCISYSPSYKELTSEYIDKVVYFDEEEDE